MKMSVHFNRYFGSCDQIIKFIYLEKKRLP